MKINFKEVKETTSTFGDFLTPGIYEVTISSYEEWKPDENKEEDKKSDGSLKSPYAAVKFVCEDGESEVRFYFSEKAKDFSLPKLKHLALAITNEEELNKIESTIDLKSILENEKVRIKLSGEEVSGKERNFIKVLLQWVPFAESINIPKEKSKLVFNETKDIKYLPVEKSEKLNGGDDDENKLPF